MTNINTDTHNFMIEVLNIMRYLTSAIDCALKGDTFEGRGRLFDAKEKIDKLLMRVN